MDQELVTKFEVYLTKDGINKLSKRQVKALLQLLRVTNTLRFQMGLLLQTKNEKEKLFQLRAQIEIYSILASSFEEAVKSCCHGLFKTLSPLSDNQALLTTLRDYEKKMKRYIDVKDDEILKIIEYLRDVFCFHMDEKLFQGFITDGISSKDVLIGTAKSEKIQDWCFLSVYDALILHVSKLATSCTDKNEIIDWLFKNIFQEVNYFCNLLEKFAGSILKKYCVVKPSKSGIIN